jgi:hypothetical protein
MSIGKMTIRQKVWMFFLPQSSPRRAKGAKIKASEVQRLCSKESDRFWVLAEKMSIAKITVRQKVWMFF